MYNSRARNRRGDDWNRSQTVGGCRFRSESIYLCDHVIKISNTVHGLIFKFHPSPIHLVRMVRAVVLGAAGK